LSSRAAARRSECGTDAARDGFNRSFRAAAEGDHFADVSKMVSPSLFSSVLPYIHIHNRHRVVAEDVHHLDRDIVGAFEVGDGAGLFQKPVARAAGDNRGSVPLPSSPVGVTCSRRLEDFARQTALANDRGQRSRLEFLMVGYDDGYGCLGKSLLQDDMAAPAANLGKPVGRQDLTDFASGKDSEPTQSSPQEE
jgi:hypothetical protein